MFTPLYRKGDRLRLTNGSNVIEGWATNDQSRESNKYVSVRPDGTTRDNVFHTDEWNVQVLKRPLPTADGSVILAKNDGLRFGFERRQYFIRRGDGWQAIVRSGQGERWEERGGGAYRWTDSQIRKEFNEFQTVYEPDFDLSATLNRWEADHG